MDRITLRSVALAAVCILIPLVSGAVIGILTMSGVTDWYSTLNKPWFTPPDYVFGPVWTVLYILMGISLYLVIMSGMGKRNREDRHCPVWRPARGKPPVVLTLLRAAFTPGRSCMYCRIACPHPRDHHHLLPAVKTCCRASRSLSCLGLHRHSIKCRGRSPELKSLTRKEPLLPGTVRTSPMNRHADLVAPCGMNCGRFPKNGG